MFPSIGGTYRLVPLEEDHATTLVTGRQIVTRLVELDSGDDIRWVSTLANAARECLEPLLC